MPPDPATGPNPSLVGLIGPATEPLARAFAEAGVRVVSFGTGTGSGADSAAGPDRLGEPDALIACAAGARTPAGGADPAPVRATARAIGARLRPGQLVVLTGAAAPGTTRTVVLPALGAGGAVAGRDFALAFSPDPEPAAPRVVGGIDPASTAAACALFGRIGPVARVSSPEAAEVCGAVGALARAVRAAAAHELKAACARMGVDAWEVFEASGAGGLVPTGAGHGPEPRLLAWGARRWGASFPLLACAADINAAVPGAVARSVADALNAAGKPLRGSSVAVLGLAGGAGAGDSSTVELMGLLMKKGAVVSYNDPLVAQVPRTGHAPLTSHPLTAEYLAAQDCVLIAAHRPEYDYPAIVRRSRLVLDACNATRGVTTDRDRIVRV